MVIEFNGTHPILTATGDTDTVHDVTITNAGIHPVVEPLTGIKLPIGETVVRITGAIAFDSLKSNLNQMAHILPHLSYAFESVDLDETEEG